MSKADEMFEKLGYRKYSNTYSTFYQNNSKSKEILFDVEDKDFVCQDMYDYDGLYITMQELQAINEKVKELGWNE